MAKDFLSELADNMKPSPVQQASSNLSAAAEYNQDPTRYGRMQDIAQRHGLTAEAMQDLPPLRLEDLDRKHQRRLALQQSEAVARFYAENPRNSIIGYRDVERLGKIETFAERLALTYSKPASVTDRMAATAAAGPVGVARGIGGLSRSSYGILQWASSVDQWLTEATGIPFGTIAHTVGTEEYDAWLQDNLDTARDLPSAIHVAVTGDDYEVAEALMREVSKNQYRLFTIGVEDVSSAGVSLAPTLLAGWAGLGLRGMSIIAGLQSGGATFADQMDQQAGLGEATGLSILSGTITGLLTRYIPGGAEKAAGFLSRHPNAKDYLSRSLVAAIGKEAALEFTEEGLDETLQGLLVNGKGLRESIADGLKAGGIGAILGGGMSVGPARYSIQRAEADRAKDLSERLDDLRNEVQQAEMSKASPQAMAQFMQDYTNLPQEVHADGSELVDLIDLMRNQDIAEQIEATGVTLEQVEQAAKTGGTVPLNLGVLMARTSNSTYEAIKPILRKDSAGMSVREGEAFENSEAAEQAAAESDELTREQREFTAEVSRIRGEIAKATKTGRTGEHAQAVSTLIAQGMWGFYNRNPEAYRALGQTAPELLRRVSVRFNDDVAGTMQAVDLTSDRVFEQGGTPEEFAAALPESIRPAVEQGVAEMRQAEQRTGNTIPPERAQKQLTTLARLEAARQGAVATIDTTPSGPVAVDTSLRTAFETAPEGWQDQEVTVTIGEDSQSFTGQQGATYLSKREKVAENLLRCLKSSR